MNDLYCDMQHIGLVDNNTNIAYKALLLQQEHLLCRRAFARAAVSGLLSLQAFCTGNSPVYSYMDRDPFFLVPGALLVDRIVAISRRSTWAR
jgi:hypothetical protein